MSSNGVARQGRRGAQHRLHLGHAKSGLFSDDLHVLSIRASGNGYLYSCVGRDDRVSFWHYGRQSGASTSAISLG